MTLLRSSADGLSTNNQTNLAIKGIIAIQAMSKMSSIVHQTADVDKYFVRETFSLLVSVINWSIEYSSKPLCPMEGPCASR